MKKTTLLFLLSAMALPAAVQAGECYVKTTWPSGEPHSGVKIGGYISWGGMVENVYTNRNGEATLKWSGDRSLANIYIDGDDRGSCKNGASVEFVVK
jgi:hypothetical protein